ncbi:hypothetical protein [Sphingobacterium litopenaei]|uniref:TerB N-terminal domain-containing protein n=1 Tax=Sphingobacterium litopenaei TaxID=2763500 RepID=A0ABR7YBZ2_9SPHI|nr:hypothetical protein [Sphingobacterium litopenaei]MBD1428809.1 hypothetical protein [Sphingobacterium litopenaei]
MSIKELFYIFLKNSDFVINRYEELTAPPAVRYSHNKPIVREDFEISFKKAEEIIDHNIRSSGRSGSEYRYLFPDHYFYLGKQGWNKYGVFSYIPFYEKTHWTLDIIEKHKNSIAWLLLFEFGNFMFSEDILREYEQYIPWVDYSGGEKKYISFSRQYIVKHGTSLSNFKNIGQLSSDFILSHISVIDINALCETAEFEITPILFEEFHNRTESEDLGNFRYNLIRNIKNNPRVSISYDTVRYITNVLNDYDWKELLHKIELNSERLLHFYRLDTGFLEVFYYSCFKIRESIISKIQEEKALLQMIKRDDLKRLYQGGGRNALYSKAKLYFSSGLLPRLDQEQCERQGFTGLKNLPYTYDFSVDLIKDSYESWNQQSYEYYSGMSRRPDTNYHYYKRVTAWDILCRQESILLTYDICKYLMSIEVKIGGSYTLEDGHYHTDDVPNHFVNGLQLFRYCSVKNEEELVKILNDSELIDFLLSNTMHNKTDFKNRDTNYSIVDRIILDFFKDFPFENFKKISPLN